MNKLITTFLSAGIAGASVAPSYAQDDIEEKVIVLGVTSFENVPPGSFFLPEDNDTGKDMVYFGIQSEQIDKDFIVAQTPCKAIVNTGGAHLAYMKEYFESGEGLKNLFGDNVEKYLNMHSFDMPSLLHSVDGAINAAIDRCELKIF